LRTALIVRNVEVIEVLSRKGARVDAGRDIFARVERHRGLLRDLQDRIESADEKGPRAERVKILRQRIRFLEDDIRNRFETVTETESRKCGLCGGDGHVLIQTPDRKPDGPPGRKLERAQCERCEGTGYIRQNRIVRKRRDTGSQERELADQQESLVLAEKALAEYVKRLNDALARACQDLLEGRDPSVSAAVE
jgi:hypothetical protein